MIRTLVCLALVTVGSSVSVAQDAGAADPTKSPPEAYPTPSRYPVAWQFDFTHSMPKRVIVNIPGQANPEAYWYMTYQVTNNSDQERMFLPVFEMVTETGEVIRSDKNIPATVFNVIKDRERNRFLQPAAQVAGELRLGEDQAKDGVAIWKEPMAEMGRFSIFVSGLSGEYARTKIGEQDFILRKTLQLDYHVRGDEIKPGHDEVNPVEERWVMR
jgi:hypothetical protein